MPQSSDEAHLRITTNKHPWHRMAINGHFTQRGYIVSVQNVVSEEVRLFRSLGGTKDTAVQFYKRIYPRHGLPDAIVSEEGTPIITSFVEHLRRLSNTDQKIWPVVLLKSDTMSLAGREEIQRYIEYSHGSLPSEQDGFNRMVENRRPFELPSLQWDPKVFASMRAQSVEWAQSAEWAYLEAPRKKKADTAWWDRINELIDSYETYDPSFSPDYLAKTMRHAKEIRHNVQQALLREQREFDIHEQRLDLVKQLVVAKKKRENRTPEMMGSKIRRKLGWNIESRSEIQEHVAMMEQGALEEEAIYVQLPKLYREMELGRAQEALSTRKFIEDLERPEHERLAKLEGRYKYEDFSSDMQFRLLRLHAKNNRDDLSILQPLLSEQEHGGWARQKPFFNGLVCSLQTFDLDDPDCPLFEALSYEWKSDQRKENRSIVVRDAGDVKGSLSIGANLFDFLAHIRQDEDDCWLWADAICINQKSLEERNSQVKLMGRIYRQAFKALAWVPVEEPSSCAAALRYLHSTTREKLTQEGYLQTHQTELERLFSLSYWSRKWIIQEVLLARTVVLVLGQPEFPMQDLEDIFAKLETAQMLDFSARPVATLANHRRKRRLRETYPQTLSELLSLYRYNECGERFDHVYALYNLIGDHRDKLEVDYDQHPNTWIEAILKFLDQHERPARKMLVHSAAILERLVGQPEIFHGLLPYRGRETFYTANAYDQGALEQCEECSESVHLREHVKRLHPGKRWIWTSRGSPQTWYLHDKDTVDKVERLNTRVMGYFRIPAQKISGLASVRMQPGDRIWQFVNTDFAFIVRLDEPQSIDVGPDIRILGRCYLFKTGDESPSDEPSYATLTSEQLSTGKQELQSYELRLTISDLFELARSASTFEFSEPDINHVDAGLMDDLQRAVGGFETASTATKMNLGEPLRSSQQPEESRSERRTSRNRNAQVQFAPNHSVVVKAEPTSTQVRVHEVPQEDTPRIGKIESRNTF